MILVLKLPFLCCSISMGSWSYQWRYLSGWAKK